MIWRAGGKGKFMKKIWAASFFDMVWILWKERNARIFDKKIYSLEELCELVFLLLGWWVRGWCEKFLYFFN